jgi:uncharacterized repeat protein (TIGR01451 family)
MVSGAAQLDTCPGRFCVNLSPRWLTLALLGSLTFGCNAVPAKRQLDEALAAGPPSAIPWTLNDGRSPCPPVCPVEPPPLPYCAVDPLADPVVAHTEYLCDGGDHGLPARVDEDWTVHGLEIEDTIAHFDTVDGCRVVQPSNCVCIYAPRFGSVRQVVAPIVNEQVDGLRGLNQPVELVRFDKRLEPTTALQNTPLQAGVARRRPAQVLGHAAAGPFSSVVRLDAVQDALAPYENFNVMRAGIVQQNEKPYLAKSIQAAIAWTDNQSVEVLVDQQSANEVVRDSSAEAVYTYEDLPGCPMLRVIKVASTQAAAPGDSVDFTIRFDNLGTDPVGNVTIIDSLTTRLEYVPGSAQSSVTADFSTAANNAGSLVLRWEVTNPLRPGEGGVVRFRAQVR